MRRLRHAAVAIFLLLFPGGAQGGVVLELGSLKSACLSVAVPANSGVRPWEIEDKVRVFVSEQLPRLRLGFKSATPPAKECAEGLPVLHVLVDMQSRFAPGLAGTLSMRVLRMVRWETGKREMANAAEYTGFLVGAHVRDLVLNGLQHALTSFASDYHRAGDL